MGKGYLTIKLFLSDESKPVGNVTVLVKDPNNGETLYTLTADENGITQKVALDAPDKETSLNPNSMLPRSGRYDVDVPAQKGEKRVIIHGVEIFDGETSILPIQMHPAIMGDTQQENTDEIYIPEKHGVDEDYRGQQSSRSNRRSMQNVMSDPPERMSSPTNPFVEAFDYATPTATVAANEVAVPTYITVHLGSPNASARNVRIPFIDYVKNVASADVCQGGCARWC